MDNEEQLSDMLTVRDVARILHIHPNTVRRWSNAGRIKAYRITARGDRRFKREDIARFITELNGKGTRVPADRWNELLRRR